MFSLAYALTAVANFLFHFFFWFSLFGNLKLYCRRGRPPGNSQKKNTQTVKKKIVFLEQRKKYKIFSSNNEKGKRKKMTMMIMSNISIRVSVVIALMLDMTASLTVMPPTTKTAEHFPIAQKAMSYFDKSSDPFHAVQTSIDLLIEEGFEELDDTEPYKGKIQPGEKEDGDIIALKLYPFFGVMLILPEKHNRKRNSGSYFFH